MTAADSTSDVLRGRCALVTGSTSGLGWAVAEALASQGADIMLNGFGEPGLPQQLCESLARQHGVRVAHHGADVSRPAEIEELVSASIAHGKGRLDILVNNAGISHIEPIEQFATDRWDAMLAVHLSAAFHSIRVTLPIMRSGGWGRIVNVASVYGLVAAPHQAAYVAAKHGLIGLTKVVALETAESAITCNAVCPGLVSTPRVLRGLADKAAQAGISLNEAKRIAMSTRQPSREYVESADVAAIVAFLCGPQASQVRGAAWTIDGAWSAQ